MNSADVLHRNPSSPSAPPARWRLRTVMAAPHRLGFFCAMLVLLAASLWWFAEQLDRWLGGALGLGMAVAPTFTHGTVMVFGFMPLFFAAFLFTAGPQWLAVPGYTPRQLLAPLGLQTVGWLLWLAGGMLNRGLALVGIVLALAGLTWMYALYWRLVLASQRADQRHARSTGTAGLVGIVCLAGIVLALLLQQDQWLLPLVRSALWGFIVVTFVSVAHRMIPFFTHNKVPSVAAWRPVWILFFLLGVAAFELLAVWIDLRAPAATSWPAWTWLCIGAEAIAGAVVLWLALRWGLLQSLGMPLLVMLHVGFAWLGLALWYSALSQVLWLQTGAPILGLGALHALTMGFLGSLILAMVSRVTLGHSGRPLVADGAIRVLFVLLQITVVVRLLAGVQGVSLTWMLVAALLWTGVVLVWGLRFLTWYGRPRVDGKAG